LPSLLIVLLTKFGSVEARCRGASWVLTPGQAHDLDGADLQLPKIQAEIVIADKAFGAEDRVIFLLKKAGKGIVIPSKSNAKQPRDYDKHLYRARHLIENFFAKLKQYRGIATRYDKTARNFLSAIYLAASVIWLN
jgi:transposase